MSADDRFLQTLLANQTPEEQAEARERVDAIKRPTPQSQERRRRKGVMIGRKKGR